MGSHLGQLVLSSAPSADANPSAKGTDPVLPLAGSLIDHVLIPEAVAAIEPVTRLWLEHQLPSILGSLGTHQVNRRNIVGLHIESHDSSLSHLLRHSWAAKVVAFLENGGRLQLLAVVAELVGVRRTLLGASLGIDDGVG